MSSIKIVSTGRFLPPYIVTNDDLSKFVDTNHEWIYTRTGIASRHFAKEITNAEMAVNAAKQAIEKGNIDISKIGYIVVATFTPDNFTPSVACMVHKALNLKEDTLSFDINAACTGFIYALKTAQGLLSVGDKKYALVIGSEKSSSYLDFTDRASCILFGDGAAAAVVSLDKSKDNHWVYGTRGNENAIVCHARPKEENTTPYMSMMGKDVFIFATEVLKATILSLLEKYNLTIDDIDHVVCHQANERIISHVYKKLRYDPSKFYINLENYGNTSAATIPIALDEMLEKNIIKSNQRVMVIGFGAGLTWGGTILDF